MPVATSLCEVADTAATDVAGVKTTGRAKQPGIFELAVLDSLH